MKTIAPIRIRSIMKIGDFRMSITSNGYSDYSVSSCCAASCPPPSWSASSNFLPSLLCYLNQCLCETGLQRMLGYRLRYRSSYGELRFRPPQLVDSLRGSLSVNISPVFYSLFSFHLVLVLVLYTPDYYIKIHLTPFLKIIITIPLL